MLMTEKPPSVEEERPKPSVVEQQLRTQVRQQEAIAQITQLALTCDDLDSLFKQATQTIANILNVEYCGILELLSNQSALVLRSGMGWSKSWFGQATISANHQTPEGHTLRWYCPVIIEDLRLETRFSGTAFLHNYHIISGASIPIVGKGQPWGVLSVYSTVKQALNTDDVRFLIAIANSLAAVTDRLQAETNLNRFFNLSLDLFCIANQEGYFKRINPQFEQVLGYSLEELQNIPIIELVHPDDRDRSLAAVQKLSHGFPLVNFENRYRCQNGSYRWLAWTAVSCESELFYCVARDVSDRKRIEAQLHQLNTTLESRVKSRTAQLQQTLREHQQAEIALRNSMMTNRALLDAIPDYMFRFSRGGRFINAKAPRDRDFCSPLEDFIGCIVEEVLPAPIAQKMHDCIDLALSTGKLQVIEYEYHHGNSTHWEARFVPNGDDEAIAIVRDISDRKLAELELQQSQHFVQRIAEASPDILYIFDLEQQCNIYSNRQIAEILGYSPEEIQGLGRNLFPMLIHPQDLPKVLAQHQKIALMDDGDILELEYRLQDKQGQWHWLVSHETVFSRNDAGLPRQMVGTASDITERKQAEERLRLSERAIASSTNSIVISDARLPDRPIVSVNPAFERITGYTAQEAIGKNCRFLQQGESNQPGLKAVRHAIATETSCTVILRNYRKDGSLFWNELSISPIYDDQGQLTHYLGIQNDITEARQTELARRMAQERLAYLLSWSPGILYSYQMFGNFRATFISDNTSQLLGYSKAEMQEPGFWASHIHPEDAPRILSESNQKLLEQGENAHEYRFQHQDGHYLWIYDQLKLVRDEDDNPLEAIGYWIDISDRKLAEQQLVTSLQEKELLLKEIHHRVKNNLLVVSNILEFQSDYTHDSDTIKILADSQHRIYSMALIHEKLYRSTDLARIDFDEYLENLIDNLAQSYTDNRQNIEIEIDVQPVSLNVETAQPCGLIVNEIISNVFKHAFPNQKDGKIVVELYRQQTGKVYLKIADNGIGLPANLDIYNSESLGLELIITLTQQLNSKLTVNRQVGTSFELTFSELDYNKRF